ncbi:hypothetical protein [Streptosporangium vulgare]|uniref:hypothetical protein n=1 Tax=Streptosporangium vulgare TaxID=46190 RepID=UPI0031E08720
MAWSFGEARVAGEGAAVQPRRGRGTGRAYLIYTSGSTWCLPKGTLIDPLARALANLIAHFSAQPANDGGPSTTRAVADHVRFDISALELFLAPDDGRGSSAVAPTDARTQASRSP